MNITRSSLLSTTLYSALLATLFWWGDTSSVQAPLIPENVFGDRWNMVGDIIDWLGITHIQRMVGAVLMFIVSLMVARIAVREVIYLERSYMPSVVYVLISSALFTSSQSIAPLLSAVFLAVASSEAIRSYRAKSLATKNVFTSGIYFGISALIYPPTAYLAPMLLLALSLFRHFDIREWITAIVALILPVALYFFTLWALSYDYTGELELYRKALMLSDSTVKINAMQSVVISRLLFFFISLLLFILSIVKFISKGNQYKRYSRLSFSYFLLFSLWLAVIMYISPVRSLIMTPILALPLAIIIPVYFTGSHPTTFSKILYMLLLLSAMTVHIIGEF